MNLWILMVAITTYGNGALLSRDHVIEVILGVYTSERAANVDKALWKNDHPDANAAFKTEHVMTDTPLWERPDNGSKNGTEDPRGLFQRWGRKAPDESVRGGTEGTHPS